jgi:hypothetical protein
MRRLKVTDNKKAKKADGKRAALTQDYEREYMDSCLRLVHEELYRALEHIGNVRLRLRAGFPKKSKRGRK